MHTHTHKLIIIVILISQHSISVHLISPLSHMISYSYHPPHTHAQSYTKADHHGYFDLPAFYFCSPDITTITYDIILISSSTHACTIIHKSWSSWLFWSPSILFLFTWYHHYHIWYHTHIILHTRIHNHTQKLIIMVILIPQHSWPQHANNRRWLMEQSAQVMLPFDWCNLSWSHCEDWLNVVLTAFKISRSLRLG